MKNIDNPSKETEGIENKQIKFTELKHLIEMKKNLSSGVKMTENRISELENRSIKQIHKTTQQRENRM